MSSLAAGQLGVKRATRSIGAARRPHLPARSVGTNTQWEAKLATTLWLWGRSTRGDLRRLEPLLSPGDCLWLRDRGTPGPPSLARPSPVQGPRARVPSARSGRSHPSGPPLGVPSNCQQSKPGPIRTARAPASGGSSLAPGQAGLGGWCVSCKARTVALGSSVKVAPASGLSIGDTPSGPSDVPWADTHLPWSPPCPGGSTGWRRGQGRSSVDAEGAQLRSRSTRAQHRQQGTEIHRWSRAQRQAFFLWSSDLWAGATTTAPHQRCDVC